jgi:hypothetical protein
LLVFLWTGLCLDSSLMDATVLIFILKARSRSIIVVFMSLETHLIHMRKPSLLLETLWLPLMKTTWFPVLALVMVSPVPGTWILTMSFPVLLLMVQLSNWFFFLSIHIATTRYQEVFSFHSDHSPCHGFEEVLACYKKIVPNLRLSGLFFVYLKLEFGFLKESHS